VSRVSIDRARWTRESRGISGALSAQEKDGRMGLMDKLKSLVGGNKDKAKGGVDKGAGIADSKTGGKYTDNIDTGADKAKDGIDKLD
jgi:hypothetical protein